MATIIKEDSALGATIQEIDLRQPLDEDLTAFISQALAENEVVFFRDQEISPQQHKDFALRFGQLQSHPVYPTVEGFPEITILENDEENPSKIEKWHTDMTFKQIPPLGSILLGKVIPKQGGDTLFASLSAAFRDLPKEMRESLQTMTAIHSFEHGFKESLAEPYGREKLNQALIDNPPVEHPVIRTHPITGKKLIFVNSLFTLKIKSMSDSESTELLEFLCEHIKQEKYQCRFSWEVNSIAFWDNRSVIHKPDNDYWPQVRRMERITIDDTHSPC
jgi:taurine dioxygenase